MQRSEEGQLQQRDACQTQRTHLGLLGDLAGEQLGARSARAPAFRPAFISMLSVSSWLTLTSEQQQAKEEKKKQHNPRLVNSG